MNGSMNIKEFAERVGVAPSTLRYYEREGLIPAVARNALGHRRYDERTERWIRFLTHLRATRMPIRDVKRYVQALDLGPDGDEMRMTLLDGHRDRIRADLESLRECLTLLNRKLERGCQPQQSG